MAQKGTEAKAGPKLEEWGEEQTLDALRRLDEMRSKITQLRSSIPDMIAPLLKVKETSSPKLLYDNFQERAKQALSTVGDFRALYARNQPLLERAKRLRQERPDGVPRITPKNRIDFRKIAAKKEKKEPASPTEPVKVNGFQEQESNALDDDPRPLMEILEDFKGGHPDIETEYSENDRTIYVTLPRPASLKFTISLPDEMDYQSSTVPRVSTVSSSNNGHIFHLHHQMTQSISNRTHPKNISLLLELLATYKDIFSTKCEACEKLVTGKAEIPYVRRCLKRKADEIEKGALASAGDDKRKIAKIGSRWGAFHESCWKSQGDS